MLSLRTLRTRVRRATTLPRPPGYSLHAEKISLSTLPCDGRRGGGAARRRRGLVAARLGSARGVAQMTAVNGTCRNDLCKYTPLRRGLVAARLGSARGVAQTTAVKWCQKVSLSTLPHAAASCLSPPCTGAASRTLRAPPRTGAASRTLRALPPPAAHRRAPPAHLCTASPAIPSCRSPRLTHRKSGLPRYLKSLRLDDDGRPLFGGQLKSTPASGYYT